jgi:hypothetical protein
MSRRAVFDGVSVLTPTTPCLAVDAIVGAVAFSCVGYGDST